MDGRACRHIHHRTTGDTLLIAGSENIFDTTMNQVDDGRCLVRLTLHRLTVFLMIHQYGRRHSHAESTIGTCTEHLHRLEGGHILRNVDKHITAVLQRVLTNLTGEALSGSVDLQHLIIIIIVELWTEVDKGIVQTWLDKARARLADILCCRPYPACRISIILKIAILIIIIAITATED